MDDDRGHPYFRKPPYIEHVHNGLKTRFSYLWGPLLGILNIGLHQGRERTSHYTNTLHFAGNFLVIATETCSILKKHHIGILVFHISKRNMELKKGQKV